MPLDQPQFNPQAINPNIVIGEDEQKKIVAICNQLKVELKSSGSDKHARMRTCYSYYQGKFEGGDLLPVPQTQGAEKDQTSRPQVFIPLTKQQVKQLYASLKLTLMPNDQNFLKIRALTQQMAPLELDLTDAFMLKLRECEIPEKVGKILFNAACMGNGPGRPTFYEPTYYPNDFNPQMGGFMEPAPQKGPKRLDVKAWNPLNYYPDPNSEHEDCSKWGYFTTKKVQLYKDNPNEYINIDKLDAIASSSARKNQNRDSSIDVSNVNGLQANFRDSEKTIDSDLYYFPYLDTGIQEHRNLEIEIAGGQVLVKIVPNMTPKGENPVVFVGWTPDLDSPYSTGPAEDTLDIQKTVNMVQNYMLESLARNGNRWGVSPDVDMTQAFGGAANILVAQDPSREIVNLAGDMREIAALQNLIGVMKVEGQATCGSQQAFQGSSNIDFEKTATEMQIMQENTVTISREVIEHISKPVREIFERLMYIAADIYTEPIMIRREDPVTGQENFIPVRFDVLKSGQFTLELTAINPSQSKMAQIESLMKVLEILLKAPEAYPIVKPILQKIGDLQGMKDSKDMLNQIEAAIQRMQLLAQQQAIEQQHAAAAGAAAGAMQGSGPEPGMAGNPQALPPAA